LENPRWRSPSLKIEKNLNIFATDRPILTKFGMLMCIVSLGPVSHKISRFQKSKMASAAIVKNSKNHNISATDLPILTKSAMVMCLGPLDPVS